MDARYYFDAAAHAGAGGSDNSGMVCDIMAKTFALVHAKSSTRTIKFASALPTMSEGKKPSPGNVLRFFFNSRDDAEILRDEIMINRAVRDYVHLGRILDVPATKCSVEYQLFRQPSLKNMSRRPRRAIENEIAIENKDPRTLEQRFEERVAAGNKLPFLRISSESNGHSFSVRIMRVIHKDLEPSTDFSPSSYGLGSRINSFRLPLFEAAAY